MSGEDKVIVNEITQELILKCNYHLVINEPASWKLVEDVIGSIHVASCNVDIDLNNISLTRHYNYPDGILIGGNLPFIVEDICIKNGKVYYLSPPITSIYELLYIKYEYGDTQFIMLPDELIVHIYSFMTNNKHVLEQYDRVCGIRCANSKNVTLQNITSISSKDYNGPLVPLNNL